MDEAFNILRSSHSKYKTYVEQIRPQRRNHRPAHIREPLPPRSTNRMEVRVKGYLHVSKGRYLGPRVWPPTPQPHSILFANSSHV